MRNEAGLHSIIYVFLQMTFQSIIYHMHMKFDTLMLTGFLTFKATSKVHIFQYYSYVMIKR